MKSKPHFICTIAFAILALFASAQPVKKHGKLSVKGIQLTNEHGKPVVLRGVSYGWSCFWPRFYNKESVKWLVDDWKCTVIRAALCVEPDGGYIKNPEESTQLIKNVVEGAISQGIYVIIDWHSHNINLNEAKTFFAEMSRLYGKYPNVIYEIFNEPDYETWQEVKAYSEALISVIRAEDPDNIILIGTPHWDQDIHIAADDPIKDTTNIMYAMHFYAATHKEELRKNTEYAIKKGLPIFVSESAGMEASGDKALDYASWQTWIDWMETNKLSWVVWSVSDKKESCSFLFPSAASTGNWKTTDMNESAIKTREYLRKYNR
jgi:endoglucanase